MRAPTISIIIPTYKRPEELEICLKEILHQIQRNSYINEEIIVCDDEHCTSLQQKLTALSPEIRYVQGPQKGPASNRNAGAKMAQGQWLIFIDDDCIPEPGWLEAYRQSFVQHPAIEALEGKVIAIGAKRRLNDGCPQNLNGDCFWSCNIAITREAFDRLGCFDESFPYAAFEDIEFYHRIKALGIRHAFLATASVKHPWKAIGGWNACIKQLSSLVVFINKHPDQWPSRYPLAHFKSVAKHLIQDLIPGFLRYKGRGSLNAIAYWCAELYFGLWLLWTRPWPKTKT